MNTRNRIMIRLLKMFPVRVIRDCFRQKEPRQDALLTTIVEKTEDAEILDFVYQNFDFSKQHVYFLTHRIKDLRVLPESIITTHIPYRKTHSKGTIDYFYLHDLKYTVVLLNPTEETELLFKWPFHVSVQKNLIILHFAIVEKNISSYFSKARRALNAGKSIDEKDILTSLINSISQYGTLDTCDLNKGIKELWKRDIIDAPYVRWKRAKSTSTEAMDEDYTFKRQYPTQYNQVVLAPLNRTVFKFIHDKESYCDHFTADPTSGKLTFPTYPKQKEHPQNVIRKVLELNR